MKDLVLTPEQAEVVYRMIMGDAHMVDQGVFNRTLNLICAYHEKAMEEKYSEEDGE